MKPESRYALITVSILVLVPVGWFVFAILSGAGLIDWFPCVSQYQAEPVEGQVVDAETGEPLEGVIIVAHWQLHRSTFAGRHAEGQMAVLEAVTDRDGRYTLPGWGPKPKPSGQYLDHESPELLIFKSGYAYRNLANDLVEPSSCEEIRTSRWDGKVIKLEKTRGSLKEYAELLSPLNISLRSILEDCNWKKIPRLLLGLKQQKNIFIKENIKQPLYGADYIPTDEIKCGSPEKFFRDIAS